MPSQPEAQGDILKEFREGTFLSSLDSHTESIESSVLSCYTYFFANPYPRYQTGVSSFVHFKA